MRLFRPASPKPSAIKANVPGSGTRLGPLGTAVNPTFDAALPISLPLALEQVTLRTLASSVGVTLNGSIPVAWAVQVQPVGPLHRRV